MKSLVKENIDEGNSDLDKLRILVKMVQTYIPYFEVYINGNYGEVRIKNIKKFDTSGSQTVTIICSYVSGVLTGLFYQKK